MYLVYLGTNRPLTVTVRSGTYRKMTPGAQVVWNDSWITLVGQCVHQTNTIDSFGGGHVQSLDFNHKT